MHLRRLPAGDRRTAPGRVLGKFVRLLVVSVCLSPALAAGDISGSVLDADDLLGIPGARVHVQADPDGPVAITDAAGDFTLPVDPTGSVVLTAALPYDAGSSPNYPIEQRNAANGDTGVLFLLQKIPASDAPGYQPPTPENGCEVCHAEQVQQWQGSHHAGAAVNEWVLDLFSGTGTPGGDNGYVFTETHDPGETGFCATCHTPLADVFDPGNVMLDEVTQDGALAGVQCLACHQIDAVNNNVAALAHLGNSSYRFPDQAPTQFFVWGPLDDVGFATMEALYAPYMKESRFCASCHEYDNPDTGAPGQTTYSEWLASPYAQPGPEFRSCQNCHMPAADEPGPISSLGGQPVRPPEQRHSHEFIGTTPQTLADAIDLQLEVERDGNALVITAVVGNDAGHAFPTGVSIRNALLHITAEAGGQPLPQTGGGTLPFYASDEVPGEQPGDLAGAPGAGFARVLEGRINGTGATVAPVLFIDAESVQSDTRIPSGASHTSEYRFDIAGQPPGSEATVTAEVLWRRAFRKIVVNKGWTESARGGPIEIVAASRQASVAVGGDALPVAIPALGPGAVALLFLLLVATAGWRLSVRDV